MALPYDSYQKLIKNVINRELTASWIKNRHKLTGNYLKSVVIEVVKNSDNIIIEVLSDKYGIIQDKGVKASRIPFSGSNGNGGKSLYIEALIRYAQQRMGLSDKDAIGAAFGIANKHKKLGMQIRTRGKGTNWLGQATDKMLPEIENLTMRYIDEIVDVKLKEI